MDMTPVVPMGALFNNDGPAGSSDLNPDKPLFS